ncbi:ABC transporter permease [Blautia sp. 2744]|uniref:ABC-2 type transporter n=4 Tax=Blautia TaxID=572511 RepID=D4LY63_9FIRM|nr:MULTISPECIES: ABC transporter permease [Blautia]MBC5741093.1 ABC transporter permease [Blautia intestinalis]RHA45430.1 ABC transporter permease [Blautia obeum]RHD31164.1 ABC transporter permease [Blautia obeum]RHE38198.1 ABC transporter permease [Blautia obeum]CBL22566.1 ABC-2 type transporter [Blautia obeum A2-162]
MLHLIKYDILVKLRNFNMTFWPLIFPLILGTFFFFAFGNLNDADFETVQVALVRETTDNPLFDFYLDQVQKSDSDLISLHEMTEQKALAALKNKEISGIYHAGMTPSLTINAHGIPESILQSILESYDNSLHTIRTILKKHPSGLLNGLTQMMDTRDLVQEVSPGGKTIDGTSQFFYALIAMACLYGCFIGFGSAITLQANLTALAARRSVTPTHKLKLILSEQISSFLIGYVDVIILLIYLRNILKLDFQGQIGKMLLISLFGSLIGVSMGLFIGSLSKIGEGIKVAVILAISMVCSFLSGLMNSSMKDTVEKHCPIINRINPAALISDAFYCINVYDDPARYYRNLLTLAVMSSALVFASFLLIRRNRYDSI